MMSVPSRSWIVPSNESSWLRLIVHIGQVDFSMSARLTTHFVHLLLALKTFFDSLPCEGDVKNLLMPLDLQRYRLARLDGRQCRA